MGDAELVFGWRTALLLVLSVQLLVLAGALAVQPLNRMANRMLAGFLVVVAGVMTPYTIGFAGFYDAWMWLTFAPFALPLFLAPLLYGYTHALVRGRAPERWWLHLAPGLAQLAYMSASFALPFDLKMEWAERVDGPWAAPVVSIAVALGLVVYSLAGLRLLAAYRRGLADQRSDDDRFAARWLGRVLAAMLTVTALWIISQGWGLVAEGQNYLELFWLHLAFGLIGVGVGAEGWRHAGLRFAPLRTPDTETAATVDWTALGAEIERKTRDGEWWREPELSIADLSRRLGANTGRVSRALNLGLGMNFSAFINGLRAEAVAAALDDGVSTDLLDLALEMGFASKASFNRAFLARYGMPPSSWRRRVSKADYSPADVKVRRAEA